ncbi:hypothetical protein EJB05_13689, partial [Eragrostis curvula]
MSDVGQASQPRRASAVQKAKASSRLGGRSKFKLPNGEPARGRRRPLAGATAGDGALVCASTAAKFCASATALVGSSSGTPLVCSTAATLVGHTSPAALVGSSVAALAGASSSTAAAAADRFAPALVASAASSPVYSASYPADLRQHLRPPPMGASAGEGLAYPEWCFTNSLQLLLRPVFYAFTNSVRSTPSSDPATEVVFHILPDIYNLHTGSIQKTLKLFGTPAMWAGLISSIFWVLYCIVVIKFDQNIAMLVSNTINCMASFNYLMSVYAHKRDITKGYILCGVFIMAISFIFVVMHWEKNPSELAKMLSGYFVLLGVFGCNGVQIGDILFRTTERAQQIATAINLLPTFIMNSATLVITVQQYPEHILILSSSLMGVVFNIIEIVLLLVVAVISHFLRSAKNRLADIEAGSRAVPSGNGSSGTTSERNELVPYEGVQEQAPVRQWELRTRATQGYQQDAACFIILSQQGARGCEIFIFRPMAHRNVYTRVILSAPIPPTRINTGCVINIPILLQASAMFDGHGAGTSPTQDNNHQEENTCVIVFQWITGEIITIRITVHYALTRAVFQHIIRRVRVSIQGVTYMVQLFEMNGCCSVVALIFIDVVTWVKALKIMTTPVDLLSWMLTAVWKQAEKKEGYQTE